MQFSIKTAFLALAVFLPLASAAVLDEKRWGTGTGGGGGGGGSGGSECKALLQSCSVNSDCCGDLCVAGVRSSFQTLLIFKDLTDVYDLTTNFSSASKTSCVIPFVTRLSPWSEDQGFSVRVPHFYHSHVALLLLFINTPTNIQPLGVPPISGYRYNAIVFHYLIHRLSLAVMLVRML